MTRTPVTSSYLICSTPRSGSGLLCEALELTGVAGCPDEYFLPWQLAADAAQRRDPSGPDEPPAGRVESCLAQGTTPNGVFAAKVMWSQMSAAAATLRAARGTPEATEAQVFAATFPTLRYVHITRRDRIAQAVSWAKAEQSGEWFRTPWVVARERVRRIFRRAGAGRESAPDEPKYDARLIGTFYREILDQDRAWSRYFEDAGVEPFRVVYEDFIDQYEETALAILDYLEIPPPGREVFRRRRRLPQRDAVNDAWAARFAASQRGA